MLLSIKNYAGINRYVDFPDWMTRTLLNGDIKSRKFI